MCHFSCSFACHAVFSSIEGDSLFVWNVLVVCFELIRYDLANYKVAVDYVNSDLAKAMMAVVLGHAFFV